MMVVRARAHRCFAVMLIGALCATSSATTVLRSHAKQQEQQLGHEAQHVSDAQQTFQTAFLDLDAMHDSLTREDFERNADGLASAMGIPSGTPDEGTPGHSTAACERYGAFEGSEDATLWRDGIVLLSSGLLASQTQGGLMLGLDLSGEKPVLTDLEIRNMPDYGFRPHGISLDNVTQRVYAISHSDALEEEAIYVFDVVDLGRGVFPALDFRYALVSDALPYYPQDRNWFLNDLTVIEGAAELYATQFGPKDKDSPSDKYLHRCTWDEADKRPDGRLGAACSVAHPDGVKSGLNGMTMNTERTRLWAVDMGRTNFDNSWLWSFVREENGDLTRLADVPLPGRIDNVEHDCESGDLTMGMMWSPSDLPPFEPLSWLGGAIVSALTPALDGKGATGYSEPFIYFRDDGSTSGVTEEDWYGVSAALLYRKYVVLGSPNNKGLLVCT